MNQFNEDNLVEQTEKFRGKYRVQSTRLKNWDYSSNGAYFITICTKNREHYFGEIANEKLQETEQSKICQNVWDDLPNHYPNCILDSFVIMPNHVHCIVIIENSVQSVRSVETGLKPVSTMTTTITTNDANKSKRYTISEIIRGYKTFTARKINNLQNTQGKTFWQPRFYDHIIRNEHELNRIRGYIVNNPLNWENDRNNSENLYI